MRWVPLLLALTAACRGGDSAGSPEKGGDPRPPPITIKVPPVRFVAWSGKPGEELEVETELIPTTRLLEGEIAILRIVMRNRSDRFVFLESVRDPSSGLALAWQGDRVGRLAYEGGLEIYTYDSREQADPGTGGLATTAPIFNQGMLVPSVVEEGRTYADETEIRVRIRLLHLPRAFELRYWVMHEWQVEERVFFPSQKDPRKDDAKKEHLHAYVQLKGTGLRRYARNRLVGDIASALKKDIPLLPVAKDEDLWTRSIVVKAEVPRREFSLLKALAAAGLAGAKDYTFCARLGAWVFTRPDDTAVLVLPDRAIPLPPTDPAIFFTLDGGETALPVPEGHVEVRFLSDSQIYFMDWYGGTQQDLAKGGIGVIQSAMRPDGTYRQTLLLPAERLLEFFERAGTVRQIRFLRGPDGGIRVDLR